MGRKQDDDVITGERREVTVTFLDIRDFTPFAEANTAEDTVSRLNALFEIVVPAVVDAGGLLQQVPRRRRSGRVRRTE
jgi:adenylate cyclase